jgi:Ni,Fe-hydrogenase III large subunit
MDKSIAVKNQQTVPTRSIPVLSYGAFYQTALDLLGRPDHHCATYHAYPHEGGLKFILAVADDLTGNVHLASHVLSSGANRQLISLTRESYPMHGFEREIAENFGVEFIYHPWKKPVRYAWNRANKDQIINNYPFYRIGGEELHEVGVGPIHAGVIEPGHFRFLCNGETVLHLEIQLGWQHRGVEQLYLDKTSLLQRTILSESIAGDTAVGHAAAFAMGIESLGGITVSDRLEVERTIAQELERIAMHIGDLSNVCIGIAYQLGASVFGALRTPVINYMQSWCGNRFGKGLIRVGGTHYPLDEDLLDGLKRLLDNFEKRFSTMADRLFSLPSALMRFENIGTVSRKQMELVGAVGMAARMTGLMRDIRRSHPYGAYLGKPIELAHAGTGDVWARMALRRQEIVNSIDYIRALMALLASPGDVHPPKRESDLRLAPDSLSVSLTEGWRGEIMHCAVTDSRGELSHYKVKDPSFHNWMALALSLRNLEISDFPINNKSYNLSYCGHDL